MRVSEMFVSVQGEGPWTGKMCVFVRMAGCNLSCGFCDSKYAGYGMEVTVEEVVKAIERYKCPSQCVVITGGEPTIQMDDLMQLTKVLTDKGYKVALETNGTIMFNTGWFDLVVVSPKSNDVLDRWADLAVDDSGIVVKWVIDPETVDKQLMYLKDKKYHNVWLMPMGTSPMEIVEGMCVIADKVREYGVDAVVCCRMHVLMGVR